MLFPARHWISETHPDGESGVVGQAVVAFFVRAVMASGLDDMRVQGVCLTATTPLLILENVLSRMRPSWVHAILLKRNIFMWLSLHRGTRKASGMRGVVDDRMEEGLQETMQTML